MTPAQFKQIRRQANLSVQECADLIRVSDRAIRRYEDGTREISGPVNLLLELVEDGTLTPQPTRGKI